MGTMLDTILLGDCLDRLDEIPDNSLDAIVTDPPYGLGNREPTPEDILRYLRGAASLGPLKKGRQHCANSILRASIVPQTHDPEAQSPEDLVSFRIVVPKLPVVPRGAVKLDNETLPREQEVHGERSIHQFHNVLVDEPHPEAREVLNHGKLCLREREGFAGCVETCRCFAQTGPTTFRVLVWLEDDSFGHPQLPRDIVAVRATERRAVLTLDVGRRTGELVPADPTDVLDAGLLLATSQDVGALPAARSLLASLQVLLRGEVGVSADGAVAFDVSIPAAVLDRFHSPHVPLKDFMDKPWELPTIAVWKKCYRKLKPGGHLLSFGGTRTFDLISLGLRAAGFESRDTIASFFGGVLCWCHGQGFPKSLNISKAIDKAAGAEREVIGYKRGVGGENINDLVRGSEVRQTTDPGGKGVGAYGTGAKQVSIDLPVTAAASEDAKRWEGWGTALKPAWEPILVYRKPLEESTVARQVLATGTGGLNIDATRIRSDGDHFRSTVDGRAGGMVVGGDAREGRSLGMFEPGKTFEPSNNPLGRWPSNLVLTHIQFAWYALRQDVPDEVVRAVYAYYGADQALRTMRGRDSGDAVRACPQEVLQFGVRWQESENGPQEDLGQDPVPGVRGGVRGDSRLGSERSPEVLLQGVPHQGGDSPDSQGEVGGSTHGRNTEENLRGSEGEATAGEVFPVEGGSIHGFSGVRTHVHTRSPRGRSGSSPSDDPSQVRPRTPCGDGSEAGTAPTQGRDGASPQRDQAGQRAGESDLGVTQGSQQSSSGSRSGASAAPRGKPRLEVASWSIPPGWDSYFTLVAFGGCKRVGTTEAPAPVINRFDDGMKPFGDGAGHPYTSSGGGTEEVPVYECAPGCPVRALDEQSGDSTSRSGGVTTKALGAMNDDAWVAKDLPRTGHNDAGGASRFFPSFEGQEPPDAPFFYTGKASKRETTLDGQVENTHPCLHPDSLVMTPEGYRPISTLGVGSHVLAADGRFHGVEAVTQHPYTSEALVEIRIAGSNITSLVTDNHPYLVWRPERNKAAIVGGSVHWLRADEIRVGDYTMTPIVLGGLSGITPPRAEDTEFWFLIGLYLAEGSKQKAGHGENVYPRFALHEDETDLVDRLRMYFAPSETTVSVYPNGGHGISVMAFDPEFGALCEELCGCGAATKKLHPCVWNLPEESLRALVDGYFAGDGGRVRNYLQAKTSSPHVASQMRFLGEMLGYKVELQWCAPEPGRIGDRAFQTVLPYYAIRMNERNRTIQGRKPSRPTVLEHEGVTYLLSYVKRLDRVPYVGDVVNLSVEGSHTFQTAAGMSHNTKKPLALMEWLVRLVCPKGGTVLDPYAGSGTTCVAATSNDMHFIGIEKDPAYHAIAMKRVGIVHEQQERERGAKSAHAFMEELVAELGDDEDLYGNLIR